MSLRYALMAAVRSFVYCLSDVVYASRPRFFVHVGAAVILGVIEDESERLKT